MGELLSSALLAHSVNGHLTGIAASDLSFTGHAELSAVAGASADSGVNFADLDVSDPESLFTFFSAQMTEAKGEVANMMQDQQARNDKIRSLQTASGKLAKWEESGVPNDPASQAEFADACKDVLAQLPPDSPEAKAIGALVNGGNAPAHAKDFSVLNDPMAELHASDFAARNNGTVVRSTDSKGASVYTVKWSDVPPPPTKDQIKSAQANIKSYTDALASDNTMGMIRIQQGVERMSQITNLCSNVLKKHNDAQDSVITNLR